MKKRKIFAVIILLIVVLLTAGCVVKVPVPDVEEGRFDEEQMQVIENLLGILLSSIEDLHLEQGLELYPDVEIGK